MTSSMSANASSLLRCSQADCGFEMETEVSTVPPA